MNCTCPGGETCFSRVLDCLVDVPDCKPVLNAPIAVQFALPTPIDFPPDSPVAFSADDAAEV